MKITSVSFHKVNIPLVTPTLWIGGVNRAWTRTIVRMQTDEGIEGVSETSGGDATLGQLHALKEQFLGEDPFDRQLRTLEAELSKNATVTQSGKTVTVTTTSPQSPIDLLRMVMEEL